MVVAHSIDIQICYILLHFLHRRIMRSPARAPVSPRVAKRLQIIAMLTQHGEGIANREIGRQLGCSEGLVRKVKKVWWTQSKPGKLVIPEDRPRSGRPRKFSKRCDHLPCLCAFYIVICRYQRDILRLARKHPFWSSRKLVSFLDQKYKEVVNTLPGGAVFRVCSH